MQDDVAVLAFQTARVSGDRLRLELPTDPQALSSMRHTLARWLEGVGASDAEGREIQFACHEACSNAMEHGFGFREASFDVEALLRDREVSITVRDAGGWRPPRDDDRGRGIGLMRALMDRVEVRPSPSGTVVVMQRALGRDGAAGADGSPQAGGPPAEGRPRAR